MMQLSCESKKGPSQYSFSSTSPEELRIHCKELKEAVKMHTKEASRNVCQESTDMTAGVLADLDPPKFGPPGPNSLADLDPPVQIR